MSEEDPNDLEGPPPPREERAALARELEEVAPTAGEKFRLMFGGPAPCPACAAWREKWLAARRYLRAANRGAECNSIALQLSAVRCNENARRVQELLREREEAREVSRWLAARLSAITEDMDITGTAIRCNEMIAEHPEIFGGNEKSDPR